MGGSRVGLELVIEQFEEGRSAEEIVKAYDTLELADVFATLAYYLRHKDAVSEYLKQLHAESETLRQTMEAEFPPITREELISRRQSREAGNASAGQ